MTNRKVSLISCFVVLLSAFYGSAWAGTGSSGGGPSVVCNGPDGKIATAQILDLEEAGVRFGLTLASSSEPAVAQLTTAFNRLAGQNWFLASDVEDALSIVESKVAFLPPGYVMAPGVDLGDSYAAIIPEGCSLEYAGYYESDGTLRISRDIWNHLDQTNRAALFMHEALYMVARNVSGQDNSLISRELNGYLFSTVQDLSVIQPIAEQITWDARSYAQVGSNVAIIPPVLVPAALATATLVGHSADVSVGCVDEFGTFGWLEPISQSTYSVKICKLLAVGAGPSDDYQVLGNGKLLYDAQNIHLGDFVAIPIYVKRNLVAPINLPQ